MQLLQRASCKVIHLVAVILHLRGTSDRSLNHASRAKNLPQHVPMGLHRDSCPDRTDDWVNGFRQSSRQGC